MEWQECITIVRKLGDKKVVAMERTSGQSNAQDQPLLLVFQDLGIGCISHLLQKRDKVLRIVIMTTSLLIGGTIGNKSIRHSVR